MPRIKINFRRIFSFLFVVLLLMGLLEIGLRISDSFFLSYQNNIRTLALQGRAHFRVLCISDTMTYAGTPQSFPNILQEKLTKRLSGRSFEVSYVDASGLTTEFIRSHLNEYIEDFRPHLVVTMLGLSDELLEAKIIKRNQNQKVETIVGFLISSKVYALWNKMIGAYNQPSVEVLISQEKTILEYLKRPTLGLKSGSGKQGKAFVQTIQKGGKETEFIKLGLMYRDLELSEKAREMFEKAINQNDQNEWAFLEFGLFYFLDNALSKAEEYYDVALNINPINDEIYFRLGILYKAQGHIHRSKEMFLKAIEMDPHRLDAYQALIDYYEERNIILKKMCTITSKDSTTFVLIASIP